MHGKAILEKSMKALNNVVQVSLETASGLYSSLEYLIAEMFEVEDPRLAFEEGRLLSLLQYTLSSC